MKDKEYSEKYDAYFDAKKNQWLEKKCEDKDCEYCANRPDKPNKDNWIDEAFNKDKPEYKVTHLSDKEAELIEQMHRS